jgi:hypothetical protein
VQVLRVRASARGGGLPSAWREPGSDHVRESGAQEQPLRWHGRVLWWVLAVTDLHTLLSVSCPAGHY